MKFFGKMQRKASGIERERGKESAKPQVLRGVAVIVLCMAGIACQIEEQPEAESKRATFGGGNNDQARQQMKKLSKECMKKLCLDVKDKMSDLPDFSVYGSDAERILGQLDDGNKRYQRAVRGVGISYYRYQQYENSYLLLAIEDDICYCLQSSRVRTNCTERVIEAASGPKSAHKQQRGHLRFELRHPSSSDDTKADDEVEFDTDTNMIVISRHNDSCNELEFRTHSGDTGANVDSAGAVLEQKVKLNMSAEAGKRFSSLD